MHPASATPRDGWPQPSAYASLDALAHELGRATASEGLDLETAIERLQMVEAMAPRRRRRRFDLAELAIALTNGWVAGVLQRDVDVSLEVLRVDAREQYRRCQLLGLDPAHEIAVVVFRTKVEARSDTAPAAIAVLRALARTEFCSGESVAVVHDKLLVLVHRTPDLAQRVRSLVGQMNDAVAHVGMSASYWIEPLSSDPTWLDEHLDALVV